MSKVIRTGVLDPNVARIFGTIPLLADTEKRRSERLTDQIDLLKEQGYRDGFAEGVINGEKLGFTKGERDGKEMVLKQGTEARTQQAEEFYAQVEGMGQQFQTAMTQWFALTEEAITDLSIQIVQRILATELQVNRQVSLDIAREVLKEVTHRSDAKLRINPNDYALFESHREELKRLARDAASLEIVPDTSIEYGVLIETEAGTIDAQVATRLELVENEFYGKDEAA